MAVCKHCGTEIEDGLEYCPNCGQSIEDDFGDFFHPVEELEEEAYNIFDAPEEFDMDGLLDKEFSQGKVTESADLFSMDRPELTFEEPEELMEALFEETPESSEPDSFADLPEADEMDPLAGEEVSDMVPTQAEEQADLSELLGMFGEESADNVEEVSLESLGGIEFQEAEEGDFLALDDLFQDLDGAADAATKEPESVDHELEELFVPASGEEEPEEEGSAKEKNKKQKKQKKQKKDKKEKQSFFQTVFGNVPVDPSKIKEEPTPEQIAAKKQKEAEAKKAKAEEKKLAAEEKKQLAQRNKDEKARQKSLAKEEKKAKKLQEAKLILEEMKETRINRVGATIVFLFFAVCAIVILSGSDIFGYAISIKNAEKNFDKAYNNNVKYYTDAYNDIYGLKVKEEDQVLNDKIMTVMFVNKELNSYNSQMVLKDYEAALHSLLLGLYRYGSYYEQAIPLGIDHDMDFVRTQILKELKSTFGISEDEAEVLRSMLAETGVGGMNVSINAEAAREYNVKLYEIVTESGLKDDSNN